MPIMFAYRRLLMLNPKSSYCLIEARWQTYSRNCRLLPQPTVTSPMIISWLMIISAISLSGQRVVMSCVLMILSTLTRKAKETFLCFGYFWSYRWFPWNKHVSLGETIHECPMMRRIVLHRVHGEMHTYYWHDK